MAIKVDNFFDKRLVFVGLGTILAMFLGAILTAMLEQKSGFVKDWGKSLAGGGLVGAGSLMLAKGNSEMKRIGFGMGGTGVSLIGADVYQKTTGKALQGTPAPADTVPDWASKVSGFVGVA